MKWLVKQFKDQHCSISSGIDELMEAGYVSRARMRDERGRVQDFEYYVYDEPQPELIQEQAEKRAKNKGKSPERENRIQVKNDGDDDGENGKKSPERENPILENPVQDIPVQDIPILENRTLLNTNIVLNTNGTNHSINQSTEMDGLIESIRERICYYELIEQYDSEEVNAIVSVIAEVETSRRLYLRIGSRDVPVGLVKKAFRRINSITAQYVLDSFHDYTANTAVTNPKALLMTFLYNAPTTMPLEVGAQARYAVANGPRSAGSVGSEESL